MQTAELVVRNRTGLHARPARTFVDLAKTFQADVRVLHGARKANGKSLVSLLALGVKHGALVRIEAEGADAAQALEALAAAVAQGLGDEIPESSPAAQPAPAPAPAPVPAPAPAAPADARLARGIPAAPGLAIGPVFQLRRATLAAEVVAAVGGDLTALQGAMAQAREQLVAVRERLRAQATAAEAAVIDVHLEILEDPELLEAAHARIRAGRGPALAWYEVLEARAAEVASLDDPLLAARSADIRDVSARVVRILVGPAEVPPPPDHPHVLVAQDLLPSEAAALDRTRVLGLCTAAGGPTSHAAILARALGVPSVVNAGPGVLAWANGATVILDGEAGTAELEPAPEALARARAAQEERRGRRREAERHAQEAAVTRDGHRVEVVANVGSIAEARKAAEAGAEGVGLLRTEFLFLERTEAPGEDEQRSVYFDVGVALQGKPVIVRTLDVGGDKPLPYLPMGREANPFLGERGIRLCLARPQLLKQQLRAILRAGSAASRLRIMFPMVGDLSEWRAARALVREVAAEVGAGPVEVGIMVEIPAAALLADVFAAEVDFMSIGSNDLTQYTLAVDRTHPTLAALADGLHPAVLQLIGRTAEAAHRAGKWVGVCGELAADPVAVPILVGLGVDELSVNVPAVAPVKARVRELTLEQARTAARTALACATAAEVRARARVP